MIRRLPQFAEHHFAALCATAGVVCNSSDQDECGWDFFLQYPTRRRLSAPADMQPKAVEAFVQVKSTRARPLVARMKLSNALRMSQAPQPCFVALVLEDNQGPRVYLRHFWKEEIKRTLKRVRAAEHNGVFEFHKRHFEITMHEVDAHPQPLDWMRDVVEDMQPSYAEEKSRILNTVGYEDGLGTMNMTLGGTAQDLLDLQLGLIESLPVSQASYVPQRFGIVAPKPELELEEATLFVTPVANFARLRLQGGSPTEELFNNASFYSADLPGEDKTLHRWRIDSGPLRIVGGCGTRSAEISMPFDARHPLADLKLYLTLADWRGVGPIGLQLYFNEMRIPLGVLTITSSSSDFSWKDMRTWTTALEAVANRALSTDAEISMQDLWRAQQRLSRFAGFVLSPSIRIDYEPEGVSHPTRAAIYYVACDVGEFCFLAVVERNTTSDKIDGLQRILTFGSPQLLDAIVTRANWRDYREEIIACYREQIARLGNVDTLLEIGDLEAFITESSQTTA